MKSPGTIAAACVEVATAVAKLKAPVKDGNSIIEYLKFLVMAYTLAPEDKQTAMLSLVVAASHQVIVCADPTVSDLAAQMILQLMTRSPEPFKVVMASLDAKKQGELQLALRNVLQQQQAQAAATSSRPGAIKAPMKLDATKF